jgi:hypothetical protein
MESAVLVDEGTRIRAVAVRVEDRPDRRRVTALTLG